MKRLLAILLLLAAPAVAQDFGNIPPQTVIGNPSTTAKQPAAPVPFSLFVADISGGVLIASNNLSDVVSAPTSRTNLGLGTIATQNANAVSLIGNNTTPYTTPGAQHIFQNSATTAAGIASGITGVTGHDTLSVATVVPLGSTVNQTSAFTGYVLDQTPQSGIVGNATIFQGQIAAAHNNAAVWGMNVIDVDDPIQAGTYTGVTLVAAEFDISATHTSTNIQGIALLGSSKVQPVGADGFTCGSLSSQSDGLAKWHNCFVVNDGEIVPGGNALVVGAQAKTGANILSDTIAFSYRDAASTGRQYLMGVSANHNFYLQTTAGTGLSTLVVDGAINLFQTGNVVLGADIAVASSGAGTLYFGNGSTASLAIGNGTNQLNLSVANLYINSVIGTTCTGITAGTVTVAHGIVTHC